MRDFEAADLGTGWEFRGDGCPGVDGWDRVIGQELEAVCEANDGWCVNILCKGWRLEEGS